MAVAVDAVAIDDIEEPGAADAASGLDSDNQQYVTFVIGTDVFGVPMAPVQEIIRPPEMVQVPLSPGSLLGLANLRGSILPIISLRHIFDLPQREMDDATRILIINLGKPIGFVVDQVARVISATKKEIEDVGAIQATVDTDLLLGVIKNAGNQAMVMILDFARLISKEFAAMASGKAGRAANDSQTQLTQEDDEDKVNELQLVSFVVAGQEYAMPIEQTKEIVRVPDTLTRVPKAPHFVEGVINLRGSVLPVVDQRRRFGLPDIERNDRQRIIVLAISKGLRTGFIVDSVTEVLKIPKKAIEPAPKLSDWQGKVIKQVANLEKQKRMILLLDVNQMLDNSEVAALSKVG